MLQQKQKYVKLDKSLLNVGDTVFILQYPTYGWNLAYKYPIAKKRTIVRITPKRTKIELNDGTVVTDERNLYAENDALQHDSSLALMFQECVKNKNCIDPSTLSKVSDENMVKIYEHVKAISELMSMKQ